MHASRRETGADQLSATMDAASLAVTVPSLAVSAAAVEAASAAAETEAASAAGGFDLPPERRARGCLPSTGGRARRRRSGDAVAADDEAVAESSIAEAVSAAAESAAESAAAGTSGLLSCPGNAVVAAVASEASETAGPADSDVPVAEPDGDRIAATADAAATRPDADGMRRLRRSRGGDEGGVAFTPAAAPATPDRASRRA